MRARKRLRHEWRKLVANHLNARRVRGKQKIFCVGRNKTGTTSLKAAFEQLGYVVGYQPQAEELLPHYVRGDFGPIIDYCRTAQVFQDAPFSYPGTFRHLDRAFPGSKFMLTVRDDAEQWYASVTSYHARLFGRGHVPTMDDLKRARYCWRGWMWESNRALYTTPESDPYRKDILIAHYEAYNQEVIEHFRNRPGDLLVINLREPAAYPSFLAFLGISSPFTTFPWENRTADRRIRPDGGAR